MKTILALMLMALALPAQTIIPLGEWLPAPPVADTVLPVAVAATATFGEQGDATLDVSWSPALIVPPFGLLPPPWYFDETTLYLEVDGVLCARFDCGSFASWAPLAGAWELRPGGLRPGIYGLPPLGMIVTARVLVLQRAGSATFLWAGQATDVWLP